MLVGNDAQLVACLRELQNRFQKIPAERTVQPGGTQNDVAIEGPAYSVFAGRLAAPVSADRMNGIALAVRAIFAAVEHVVGRNVDQRDIGLRAGGGEHGGTEFV